MICTELNVQEIICRLRIEAEQSGSLYMFCSQFLLRMELVTDVRSGRGRNVDFGKE